MAEISKQALKVANNTEFPNNNAGAITPSRLRGFNTDMIDSLVDEISYTADSASWEQSIAALEAFTGSATGLTTGSLLITASANLNTITFTKGNGSTFNVLVNTGSADLTDLGPLNAFTASVAGTNAFTQSANLRLNSLEATTASLNTSVSNLNTFTQSIQIEVNGLEAKTGSYATTGSNIFVGNQTIVGSVSASSFVSASRFIGDGSQITGITASVATTILNDGVLQGTATSLNFTGSGVNATVVAGVAIIQSEVDQSVLDRYTTTASFNAYTQSTDAKINSINGFTASVAGTNNFTASIAGTNTFTASLAATNAFTASIAGTNTFTASIAGTNAFTQSANARLNSIEAQSGSWVTAAITASSLTTASFSGNTLSFTKGDGSTFGVVIPDVSGSATLPAGVVSGSAQIAALGFISSSVTSSMAVSSSLYAVTASIAREVIVSAQNANQSTLPIGTVVRITGANGDNPQFNSASWESDSASANALGILAHSAPSGQYADITVVGKLVGVNTQGMAAGDLLYLSSSGQFTNVQPQAPLHIVTLGEVLRVQQNNGSMFVNISNGWELNELHNVRITSVAQGDLLVYEASSSLWKNQPSSSFVKIEQTGSFATTGSNTFLGNEIFSGNIDVRDNIYAGYIDMRDDGGIFFRASGSNVVSGSAEYWSQASQFQVGDMVFVQQPSNDKVMSLGLDNRYVTFYKGIDLEPGFEGVDVYSTPLIISSSFGGQTEILDVKGNVSASNLNLSGALTASLQEGYIWVGGSNNKTILAATASFATSAITASSLTTASFAGGTMTFTKGDGSTFGVVIPDVSGSIDTGSFATTGSNVFTGTQTLSDASLNTATLATISGSLVLVGKTFTSSSAALAHISASSADQVNFIWKANAGTQRTIVSGSNNIFNNPSNVTAGFVRYVGGSNNIIGLAIPQLTGSAAFPVTMGSNIIQSGVSLRAPVSSSIYNLRGNLLLGASTTAISLGTSAANNFERAVSGLTMDTNVINGVVNAVASKTTLSASVSITNNNIGGTATLNMDSSSINLSNSIVQGSFTINNSYFPSTLNTNASFGVSPGLFIGTHTLYASGSNTSTTAPRVVINSAMVGTANVVSASLNGDLAQVNSTILLGQSLTVIGSNSIPAGTSAADWGSVFAGRWNSIDGTKDMTAETVFAVGTGTSTSNRKTGFLIDSGSNTFVEGTLNVSGSTTITGSLTLSSSLDIELNVMGNVAITGAMNFLSGSASGSVITNVGDTFTGSAAVTKIISLSSAEYSAVSPKDPNTLYIIV